MSISNSILVKLVSALNFLTTVFQIKYSKDMVDGHEDFLAGGLTVCDGFNSVFIPEDTRTT
jgi:hypothetical protein